MDKKLLLYKLDRLLHLLETTEPKEEKLPDNELFTSDLIMVRDWYDTIETFDKWSEELDIVSVMNQANSIWKFRHKIKKLGWDNYNTTDEEIKAHILKGEKIAAIKLYRKHQCEVCGKQVSLKEAKEYVDAIQKTLSIT
tara:strand:+ start:1422 stop:1838 length:417 start_codon:yes stop_codon:yes gene_type:complete